MQHRQLLQQSQQLRKVEGESTMLGFQPGSSQGGSGGSNSDYHESHQQQREETQNKVQLPQNPLHQARLQYAMQDAAQQKSQSSQNKVQLPQNPLHQARLQYAMQDATQQKSQSSMQAQPQQQMGGPSWKGQEMVTNNMQMQDLMSPHQPFLPPMKQQLMSSPAGSENSAHVSSSSEMSGQAGSAKNQAVLSPGSLSSSGVNTAANSNNIQLHQHQHQLAGYGRENQSDKVGRDPSGTGNDAQVMHLLQSSGGQSQGQGHSETKLGFAEAESIQMQHFKPTQQLPQQMSQPAILPRENVSNHMPSQSGAAQMRSGFTEEQLHVLKVQILAFRRIKRGDRALPEEVLREIAPPPLDLQLQHQQHPSGIVNPERPDGNIDLQLQHQQHPSGIVNPERPDGNIVEENTRHAETSISLGV